MTEIIHFERKSIAQVRTACGIVIFMEIDEILRYPAHYKRILTTSKGEKVTCKNCKRTIHFEREGY